MKIKIVLIGLLKSQKFPVKNTIFPDHTSVQDIIDLSHLPEQHIGTVLINGKHATFESYLSDGDTLTFVPIIGGG